MCCLEVKESVVYPNILIIMGSKCPRPTPKDRPRGPQRDPIVWPSELLKAAEFVPWWNTGASRPGLTLHCPTIYFQELVWASPRRGLVPRARYQSWKLSLTCLKVQIGMGCFGKLGGHLLTIFRTFLNTFPSQNPNIHWEITSPKTLSSSKNLKTSIEDQSQQQAMEMDSWRCLLWFSWDL